MLTATILATLDLSVGRDENGNLAPPPLKFNHTVSRSGCSFFIVKATDGLLFDWQSTKGVCLWCSGTFEAICVSLVSSGYLRVYRLGDLSVDLLPVGCRKWHIRYLRSEWKHDICYTVQDDHVKLESCHLWRHNPVCPQVTLSLISFHRPGQLTRYWIWLSSYGLTGMTGFKKILVKFSTTNVHSRPCGYLAQCIPFSSFCTLHQVIMGAYYIVIRCSILDWGVAGSDQSSRWWCTA